MTTSKVYEHDIGTEIKLNAGTSLDSYTVLEIHYLKPGNEEGIWTASQVESTKGKYITISGDLVPNGPWKLKLHVVFSGGGEWWGNTVEMSVYEKWA